MVSRRKFMQASAMGGAVALAPSFVVKNAFAQAAPQPLVGTTQIPFQFTNQLPNPLAPTFNFLPTGLARDPSNPSRIIPAYDLQIRQTTAQTGVRNPVTGAPMSTTVWGYGTRLQPPTFPGRTFQLPKGTRVQVSYNNRLVDARGGTLPSLLPIDTTLDWANTGNNGATAPVPLVAHLHGGDSQYLSDGLPDAWETPNEAQKGGLWSKPYIYDNAQEAGHLWYHDHALGVTRTNVYAGLAGNYFIRGVDELLLVGARKLPSYPYEVPIVLQDRNFLDNGQLYYPSDPSLYPDLTEGQQALLPNPTHLPEFFGDVMLVNGVAWPNLDVEPRQYRLRLLNGSDSRVYELKLERGVNAGESVPMYVIGTELGMINSPTLVGDRLIIAPGERYDVVVDFTGKTGPFILTNTALSPFRGSKTDVVGPGDPPGTTEHVMRFNVVKPLSSRPVTTLPQNLRPLSGPLPPVVTTGAITRRIMLFEGSDPVGRLMTMMGPVDPVGTVQGTLFFKDPITERPTLNSTEIWEFYNTTVDAHPIHMHLVDFRILNRRDFTGVVDEKLMGPELSYIGGRLDPDTIVLGDVLPSRAEEQGRKDTVITEPGTVTRVITTFKRPGPYVYHCHILSHEDHEMMRPYEVTGN